MEKITHSLSVVMPAYNEENRLPDTLNNFSVWVANNSYMDIELIIVNDGSTDTTREIILSYIEKYSWIKLIDESHVGMMNAIVSGINNAKYSLIGTLEADSPVHLNYFLSFLPFMEDNDVIIGSRFLGKNIIGKSLARRIISKVNSLLFTTLFSTPVKDPQISFRIYNKKSVELVMPLLALKHDGFKSSEIAVKLYGLGLKIKEMPVEYFHDEDSKAVPGGLAAINVTLVALLALFQLWVLTIKEYNQGVYSVCPLRGAKIIDIFLEY